MNDYGTFTEPGTIVFRRLLPGPIERVWAYLTESDKRGLWLARGEMELWQGGRVELRFLHAELSPVAESIPERYADIANGTAFSGHITRIEEPRLLAFTWGESWGEDSEVCFELTSKGDQVSLLLTHRRLGEARETLLSVASGWHTHLGILIDRLEGRDPQPFWSMHNHYEADYAQRLPSTGATP